MKNSRFKRVVYQGYPFFISIFIVSYHLLYVYIYIYINLIQWNFVFYFSPPVNFIQCNCILFAGAFYFTFNRTYVYLVYNLIVYLISRYRIKFYTIYFGINYISYNTFVCDYLYLYLYLIQFCFTLYTVILYYLISFVFYTMEFDNSFLPPNFVVVNCILYNLFVNNSRLYNLTVFDYIVYCVIMSN